MFYNSPKESIEKNLLDYTGTTMMQDSTVAEQVSNRSGSNPIMVSCKSTNEIKIVAYCDLVYDFRFLHKEDILEILKLTDKLYNKRLKVARKVATKQAKQILKGVR